VSAEQQPADPLIGQVLASRYEILHRLGEGAMGAVYKARHVKVGRPFAVKVLHPRLLVDAKVAMRFDREAELAGRLRHANVVGVVDVGEVDDTRYMVMDFAEGPDLAQLLVEAPMPPARIIHLVRQMLEGLYHAHERGLIHRDFKPENVIIERDTHGAEMPRIVDFGIAILRDAGEDVDGQGRLTTNGLVLGTPHYMAPEQAVADPIDHRIDLFALGIVIYEMLSGRLPFDGSGAEVARANLLLDPPPIMQRVPYLEVDPLLEAFARRLMAKKRGDRPPTAKAARELLDLIERDRRAASAALGIAMSERTPAATLPVDPQDPGLYTGTQDQPTAQMKPTPLPSQPVTPLEQGVLAPPLRALPAQAVVFSPPREHRRPTSLRTPLSWEAETQAKGRRSWLIASAIVGAGAIAAALLLVSAGDPDAPDRPVAPGPSERLAMTPSEIAPAPPPPSAIAVVDDLPARVAVATPPATDPAPVDPASVDPASVDPTGEPRPPAVDSKAAAATPEPVEPARAVPASPPDPRTRVPKRVATRPAGLEVATPGAIGRKADPAGSSAEPSAGDTASARPTDRTLDTADRAPASDTAPVSIKAQAMAGITPNAIAKLYYSIRPQLDQLPEAESQDLRERLRLFDIQKLMIGTQADRDKAAPQMVQLLNEALARKATRSGAKR
jgi:serine/threonine protein kinase